VSPAAAVFGNGASEAGPASPGTFAAFVVGGGNRLAYAAAKSVAEHPAGDYNPVLLHGPPGLGKTHLLSAIEAHVLAAGGARAVRAPARELVQELLRDPHAALRLHGGAVDLLLVDDLDEVLAWGPPPPEALRAVERLLAASPQVVVAAARPPEALAGLGPRAVARLAEGLVVELEPPDVETRAAILRVKLRARGADPVPDLVEELAGRAFRSVRDLESAADEVAALSAAGPLGAPDLVLRLGDRLPPREVRRRREGDAPGRRRGDVPRIGRDAASGAGRADGGGRASGSASPFDDPGEAFLEWMPLEDRLAEWRG
jgi:chromosomal replication initiator protein